MSEADAKLPIRCMTLDVEEHFHIEAARGRIDRHDRARWPSRVEASMDKLLGLMDRLGCRATLFMLGEVAKDHPELVRRCAAMGHEIASHGWGHERLHRLDPLSFREDLLASKHFLEDLTGCAVRGYRAPTWSVTRATAWAVEVIGESGFEYDASVFPVRHPWYGVVDAPLWPFVMGGPGGGTMLEFPPLVARLAGRRLAVAGGGYFRLLPLSLMKMGLAQAAREGRPAILYFHPWEFDADLPRLELGLLGRVRTYTGLGRALGRLERVLSEPGTWRPIADDLAVFERMARQRGRFELGGG